MKFWQPIAWVEPEQLLDLAKFAEEVGFHGFMVADHALFPGSMAAGYPYSDNGLPPQTVHSPYPDCWAIVAAMAAVTKTLNFTTGVYVLPLRPPFEVANSASTIALLSNNRFQLGVGSGWMKEEFDVYGVPFKQRGKIMTECVEIIRKLCQGGMQSYDGEYFSFPDSQINPAVEFPIYFGGAAKIALKRCAKYGDGWIGTGNYLDEVPAIMQTLSELRREHQRDHLYFDTLVGIKDPATLENYQRLAEMGVTSGLNLPFSYVLGERSSLDDKKRYLEQFSNTVIRQFNS